MIDIENLLNSISTISKEYEEIAKQKGEYFNIFKIMNMENNEVYTHSAIIGELLNPNGSHNQGSLFLKLFFDEIDELNDIKNFNFEKAIVIVEEFIGITNRNYTRGGRIDLVIKDQKNVIVIENKIYASDQKGQLLRYKNQYPNARILYLTLFGEDPSEFSIKINSSNFINSEEIILISYQKTIVNWLEKCFDLTNQTPMVSIILNHYLNTIKELTNQTASITMEKNILDYILKNNTIKETFLISNVLWSLKEELYKRLALEIENYCTHKKITYTDLYDRGKHYGFSLKPLIIKDQKFNMCFFFEKGNFKEFFYGIEFENKLQKTSIKQLQKKFEQYQYDFNEYFIWKYFEDGNWEDSAEIWLDISKGVEGNIYKEIILKIEEIIEILNS